LRRCKLPLSAKELNKLSGPSTSIITHEEKKYIYTEKNIKGKRAVERKEPIHNSINNTGKDPGDRR
jgi:hypothetical protein